MYNMHLYLVVMLLPPYIAVTFRHGASLAMSFVTVYVEYILTAHVRIGINIHPYQNRAIPVSASVIAFQLKNISLRSVSRMDDCFEL